jgi:hypothetical protein
MKKFILIVSLLLPVFISYSQETTKNATLTLSPVLKDKRINLLTVITQNNEGYFITVLRKNKLFLEQIDYNLNIVKSINLSDKEESDITITHYDDFFINGNIYISLKNIKIKIYKPSIYMLKK